MRVTIEHKEKTTGLVFKKTHYEVHTTVVFSELERQVIEQRALQKRIIMERIPSTAKPSDDPNWFTLTIAKLMRGTDVFTVSAPSDAKEYELELKASLKELKEFLDQNETTGGSETFEL